MLVWTGQLVWSALRLAVSQMPCSTSGLAESASCWRWSIEPANRFRRNPWYTRSQLASKVKRCSIMLYRSRVSHLFKRLLIGVDRKDLQSFCGMTPPCAARALKSRRGLARLVMECPLDQGPWCNHHHAGLQAAIYAPQCQQLGLKGSSHRIQRLGRCAFQQGVVDVCKTFLA